MKKVVNKTVSEYTVSFRDTSYKVQPQSSGVFEDEVAKEFVKYYPTILKVEDVVEIPVPIPKPEVETPTEKPIEQPKKVEKIKESKVAVEKIKEKISTVVSKNRGKPKKSKK